MAGTPGVLQGLQGCCRDVVRTPEMWQGLQGRGRDPTDVVMKGNVRENTYEKKISLTEG